MIHCPKCNGGSSGIVDTRPRDNGVRRTRRCVRCEHRFHTLEAVSDLPRERDSLDLRKLTPQQREAMRAIYNAIIRQPEAV